MPATFDGDNLRIILPSGVSSIDAKVDLYSDWKEWVKIGDNAKYLQAFDTTGGDPITATEEVAPYYFLRNDLGWRIRGPEEDATILISGNLFGRDGDLPIFVPTLGAFTQQIQLLVSSRAIVETVETSGGGIDFNDLMDLVDGIETGLTLREGLRLVLATLAGKMSGGATTTVRFRDVNDTKDRVTATVDESGNRTAVTTDVS